jgi:dihydrofolate synthase / folylpolyglutamate synthase
MSENDYQSALKLLYDRINYERSSHAPYTAMHYRLDRMRALLDELGNPQQSYDIVHIAGTKGKGTTANLIYDGLRANGRRVGLYTASPT